ncbi:MAG: hypothetical protein WA113_07710 [Desulfitobacteriaceae bacterium]
MKNKGIMDEIIEGLINERLFNKAYQTTRKTSDYDWKKESLSLSQDIINKLGVDKEPFMRYEELLGAQENELQRNAYKQGLRDGIELLREIFAHGQRSNH